MTTDTDKIWLLVGGASVVALAAMPFVANEGVTFLVGLAMIEAVFALSWNLLFHYTGLASFGQAAFFAIGAYLVGSAQRYGWPVPFLLQLLLTLIAGAFVALIVGAVALKRASGIHFAILTLAVAEVVRMIIGHITAFGRDEGLGGIPRPSIDLGFAVVSLRSASAFYWCIFLCCFIMSAGMWWFVRSRYGRALRSIALDAERASFVGIDIFRYRMMSFTLAGAIAGVCGGLSAPWVRIVTPDLSHWLHSAQPMLNSLLGGSSYFWGPVVGAFIYSLINYSTRTLAGASEIVIGSVLIAIILIAPSGVTGTLDRAAARLLGKRKDDETVEKPGAVSSGEANI